VADFIDGSIFRIDRDAAAFKLTLKRFPRLALIGVKDTIRFEGDDQAQNAAARAI